ncbi:MAG TPA: hypothetical protein VMB03_33945 [Bryobacteraceae bacterium]|nr:hypothetical protein [Bryobacteraceae bacterium]
MPTPKQLAANRLNAQKSTGPRTAAGKARSARNALRSGIDASAQTIIHRENAGDLEVLKWEYEGRFHPSTPEQRALVDTLIDCEFLLRRFRFIEAQLWEDGMQNTVHKTILGEAFRRNCDAFTRLQRRIDSTQRNYRNALHELERLQSIEAEVDADPEPSPVNPRNQTPNSEIGFVPQSPSVPPAEPPQPGAAGPEFAS